MVCFQRILVASEKKSRSAEGGWHYDGPITIEREIEGPKQAEDILKSKQYLEKPIRETYGSESLK